jgi:hypothetical protein
LPLFTRITNKSTEFKFKTYSRHIDYSNWSLFFGNNNSKYKHIKEIYTIQVGVYTKNRYECCVGRKTTPFCVQQRTKGTCPSTLKKNSLLSQNTKSTTKLAREMWHGLYHLGMVVHSTVKEELW